MESKLISIHLTDTSNGAQIKPEVRRRVSDTKLDPESPFDTQHLQTQHDSRLDQVPSAGQPIDQLIHIRTYICTYLHAQDTSLSSLHKTSIHKESKLKKT